MKILVMCLILLLIPIVIADCAEDKLKCYEDCNKECGDKKYAYCRTYEYSGCALDVFCDCNKCDLYDSKWCPKEGFNDCASVPTSKYETCIKTCQTDREGGKDVSTCWNDCNSALVADITPCKDEQCETDCTSQGYDNGKWASYTSSGYDSCECSGVEAPELFPDEPPLDVMESSEPQQFPDEKSEDSYKKDPFDNYDESSALESTINVVSGKTFKDYFKYWFSSEENKGTKGKVGFVKAVKDKKGLRVFRNGKYHLVGVHTSLFPGDQLRTGPNSKMKLILFNADGTQDVVDVRSNSLFEVPGERSEDHDDTIRIAKVVGSIVATVTRRIQGKKPDFYVKTPTVSSGIRGTKFYIGYDNSTKETSLMVFEGEVEFTGETTVLVGAGEQIKADDVVLGEIEDLDTARWDEVIKQDWDEVGKGGFFTIPAVKVFLVILVLGLAWFGYKFLKKG